MQTSGVNIQGNSVARVTVSGIKVQNGFATRSGVSHYCDTFSVPQQSIMLDITDSIIATATAAQGAALFVAGCTANLERIVVDRCRTQGINAAAGTTGFATGNVYVVNNNNQGNPGVLNVDKCSFTANQRAGVREFVCFSHGVFSDATA